jgi:hypothetical protein
MAEEPDAQIAKATRDFEAHPQDMQEKALAWVIGGLDAERSAVVTMNTTGLAGSLAFLQTNPLLGRAPLLAAACFFIGICLVGFAWQERVKADSPFRTLSDRYSKALSSSYFHAAAAIQLGLGSIVLIYAFANAYL